MARQIIELTTDEQAFAKDCVKKIDDNKRAKGLYRPTYAPGSINNELTGVAGEIAFHKWFGKQYELKIFDVRDYCDIVIKGMACDIKTTRSNPPYLRVYKSVINKPVSMYILVRALFDIKLFEVIGWSYKNHFLNQAEEDVYVNPQTGQKTPYYKLMGSRLEQAQFLKMI